MDCDYEYDAPRFYDFKRTDEGVSMASAWFDAHEEGGLEGAPASHASSRTAGLLDQRLCAGLRSPLSQLQDGNQATSKVLSICLQLVLPIS